VLLKKRMVCRQYTLYSSVIEELHKLYDKTSVTQRHTRVRILSEVVAYYNFNSYTSIFTNPKWFIQCSTPRPKQYPNKSNTKCSISPSSSSSDNGASGSNGGSSSSGNSSSGNSSGGSNGGSSGGK
jgi:uncharacterized membrane protein YgcG